MTWTATNGSTHKLRQFLERNPLTTSVIIKPGDFFVLVLVDDSVKDNLTLLLNVQGDKIFPVIARFDMSSI